MSFNSVQQIIDYYSKEEKTVSIRDRYRPGGDKYESIKADEQAERVGMDRIQAEEERLRMMGVVDISEQEDAE